MTSVTPSRRALRELAHRSMNYEAPELECQQENMPTSTPESAEFVLPTPYRTTVWTPNTSLENPDSISPDEQIIRLRGRRIFVRSPEKKRNDSPKKGQRSIQDILRSPKKTPKKSPTKILTLPLRSSPRKRFHPSSPDDSPIHSPSKVIKSNQRRIQWHLADSSEVHSILPALSQPQLVRIIEQIINSHPDIEQVIRKIIPPPDLSALDARLACLQSNIYTSFPKSRWGSKRDAYCFHRVSTHIDVFKRECIQMGHHLVEVGEWLTVVEYVLLAWRHVEKLPDWENPSHNKAKQQCFRLLAGQCMKALQFGHFKQEQYDEVCKRLHELESNKDLETCLNFVEKQKKMNN